MRWFRDRKVGTKLGFGFFVMVLFMGIIGFTGYKSISNIARNLNDIFQVRLPSINYVLKADRDLSQLLVAERSMIFANTTSEVFQELVKDYEKNLRNKIAPFTDVPIIFTSAKTKQRIHKILEIAIEVYNNRKRRISTSELNSLMAQVIDDFPPPAVKGKYIRIKYVTQLSNKTPSFAFFCNLPQYVKDPYKRYLENKLRVFSYE